jgi:hypothetical protein
MYSGKIAVPPGGGGIVLNQNDLGKVELQYSKLLNIDWTLVTNCDNVYEFWSAVAQFKDADGNLAFEELGKYGLNLLSLPSSNAVVERVFSVMKVVKTKTRNRMMLQMVEAILRIRISLYNMGQCCKKFKCTQCTKDVI